MRHPLIDWLKGKRLSRKAFAKRTSVSDATLHRLIHGTGTITTTVIQEVSTATDGAVDELELFEWYIRNRDLRAASEPDAAARLSPPLIAGAG